MTADRVWIIYDERARTMGTDSASVLETCSSAREARRSVRDDWPFAVIAEYDLVDGEAVNERIIE